MSKECQCWIGHGDCGGCSGVVGIGHEPACGWEWNPQCPEHGGDLQYPVVLNPEAIGNPDMTPIVQCPPALTAWLKDPAHGGCRDCDGVQWYHEDSCPTKGGAS